MYVCNVCVYNCFSLVTDEDDPAFYDKRPSWAKAGDLLL